MGKNNNRKGQHLPPPVVVVSEEPPALPEMNQSEIPQAAGKVGVSNSDFAQRKNTLNRLINDLRLTGAGLDVKLPRIAVIGNQSAGKSSLIEALSAIRLPRSIGTCTRCPMEIVLENSSSAWKCRISIRYEDDEVRDSSTGQGFRQIKFGDALSDPALVESTLRRAQLAILNPSVPALKFVSFDLSTIKRGKAPLGSTEQRSFSSNVVVVEISSPETTDLTFVDLPGIISNTTNPDDAPSIELIRNMCINYIKDDDCLILLTLTMKDDIDNQSAAALARTTILWESERSVRKAFSILPLLPLTRFCAGILTKPDTVADGESAPWLDILAGNTAPLKYGYHCTKQPAQKDLELNLSFAEYREAEKRFFASNEPWASLDGRMKKQLGTLNLTTFLSVRLSEYIGEKLPGMIAAIGDSHQSAITALANLPSPPSADPVLEIFSLFSIFIADLDGFSAGAPGKEILVQEANKLYGAFRKSIKATVPRFIPWTEKEILSSPEKGDYEEEDGNDDDEDEEDDDEGAMSRSALTCNLDDIRNAIQAATSRELHGNSPYAVISATIARSLKPWPPLVADLLQSCRSPVQRLMESLTEKHFDQYKNSSLRATVLATMMGNIDVLFADAEEHLLWLNQLNTTPYTQNHHYLINTRANRLAAYNKTRQKLDIDSADSDEVHAALSALLAIGYSVKKDDLSKLLPPDEYSQELDVMAQAASYFKVARKREIDIVPAAIDVDIVRILSQSAMESLLARFELTGLSAKQNAEYLLSETALDSAMRADLEGKKKRLAAAIKTLSQFGVYSMSK